MAPVDLPVLTQASVPSEVIMFVVSILTPGCVSPPLRSLLEDFHSLNFDIQEMFTSLTGAKSLVEQRQLCPLLLVRARFRRKGHPSDRIFKVK
ncbi:unnamed protein product [Coregonus sp. 'balchen']|nr:unnamed protein product [Coregonus sp. 'balchen']